MGSNLPSGPHAVMAHYFVKDDAHRTQGALTPDEWRRGLDAYGDRLISAPEWIKRAVAGELSDEVTVTIDDGLYEAYLYAKPALDERGIRAAWNIYSLPYVGVPLAQEEWRWVRNRAFPALQDFYDAWWGLIGGEDIARAMPRAYLADYGYLTDIDRLYRYWRNELASPQQYETVMSQLGQAHPFDASRHWLSFADLQGLVNAGHVVGLHTHTHPLHLVDATREQIAMEWATCAHLLHQFRPTTASYPCGQMMDASIAWFKSHGIELAWGATMKGEIPWNCPRFSTGYWK